LYGFDIIQRYEDEQKLAVYFGGMYRWNDAVIPVLKLNIYNLGVGLSYDINISKLKTASQWRGGFEFTLGYIAKLTHRSEYSNKVKCVSFGF
jgi:Type IX secretion system membrane protein PorP/SprF